MTKRCLALFTICSLWSLLLFAKALTSDWDYYQKYGHTSAKWDGLVEAGLDTFDTGNLATAQNFFKRAMALGCKDGLVIFKLAQIVETKGNLKGALELYLEVKPLLEKNYANYPNTKSLAEHLAGIYYQLERYDEALPLYLEAIQTTGGNFVRLYLVGQIYRIQAKPNEAMGFFARALTYAPPGEAPHLKPLAQVELMRLYYAVNQLDQALNLANAILQANPAHPEALALRDQIKMKYYKEQERKAWERILNQ